MEPFHEDDDDPMGQDTEAPVALVVPSEVAPTRGPTSEKIERAETRLAKDPYDIDAWNALLLESQTKNIAFAREIYERALKIMPTAVRYWKLYIEQEMRIKNSPLVEQLFSRCLLSCPNMDLWKMYVGYIRTAKEGQAGGREEVGRAYEFALEHMGLDFLSTPLWVDYIAFLRAGAQDVQNERDRELQFNAVRRAYQRATEQPIQDVERLWRELEALEASVVGPNKMALKMAIGDLIPKYTTARTVARDKKGYYDGLNLTALPRPPRGSPNQEHQAQLWRRLLAYERSNPQRLDAAGLRARVAFAYNQCLLCMYFWPGMWYDYASWLAEAGHTEAATQVFDRALVALPNSLILHFAYADFLESVQSLTAAEAIYTKLVARQPPDPLVWVQYMKFARRAKGAAAARQVFLAARKSEGITYHVFVASAAMEYYMNKDPKVARNLFELGMKAYAQEPAFVAQYAELLKHLNEENNLRVLYERALVSLPKEKALDVWTQFLEFEYLAGDLATVAKLEKRRQLAYPETEAFSGVRALIQRYKYLDLVPCSPSELESLGSAEDGPGGARRPLVRGDGAAAGGGRFPRPDLTQMVLYKPEMGLAANPRAATALHLGVGAAAGPFAGLSEAFVRLLSALQQLPPPSPPLDPDAVMLVLDHTPLGPPPLPAPAAPAGAPVAKEAARKERARKKGADSGSDEEDEARGAAPSSDVFQSRQAAKLRKKT